MGRTPQGVMDPLVLRRIVSKVEAGVGAFLRATRADTAMLLLQNEEAANKGISELLSRYRTTRERSFSRAIARTRAFAQTSAADTRSRRPWPSNRSRRDRLRVTQQLFREQVREFAKADAEETKGDFVEDEGSGLMCGDNVPEASPRSRGPRNELDFAKRTQFADSPAIFAG